MKTIAIGADDAAYAFRDTIVAYLNGLGINVADYSSDKRQGSTVYPDVAHAVAMSIKQGEHERGILICGTGIGMSIVANKVPGVRAAQCHDTFSAERQNNQKGRNGNRTVVNHTTDNATKDKVLNLI